MYDVIYTVVVQTAIILGLLYVGYRFLARKIGATIEGIVQSFLEKPLVKGSMSVLGKKGNESQSQTRMAENIATKFLSNPKIQGWKMLAKSMLGIDVDEMIAEEGAVNTIAGIKTLGDTLGFDFVALMTQGSPGIMANPESGKTSGQYLRG